MNVKISQEKKQEGSGDYAEAAISFCTISLMISAGVLWTDIALVNSQSAERSSMVMECAALRR
jgi:hypothetical protein